METRGQVLLDTTDTGRRVTQQAGSLGGGLLMVAGFLLLALSQGGLRLAGVLLAAAGAGFFLAGIRLLVDWEIGYKGHVIRFENHVVLGERLIIDGERIPGGVLGYRKTIQGTLKTGEGLGDRITAESRAGLLRFRCRIVAESTSARGRKAAERLEATKEPA